LQRDARCLRIKRVFTFFGVKKKLAAPQLSAVAALRRRWVSVRHASMWNQSIMHVRRFLFCGSSLIKCSCCAWPACRLLSRCATLSSFQFGLLCTTFAMFSRLLCNSASAGARYSFSPANSFLLPNCCEKCKRNLTCATRNLALFLRPFRQVLQIIIDRLRN
jgi:hypothetical protein